MILLEENANIESVLEQAITESRIQIFHSVSKDSAPDEFRQLVLKFNELIDKKKLAKMKKSASLVIKGNRIRMNLDLANQAKEVNKRFEDIYLSLGMKASSNSIYIDPNREHGNIFYKESKDRKYIYVGYYELPFELRDNGTSTSARRINNIGRNLGKYVFSFALKKAKNIAKSILFKNSSGDPKETITKAVNAVNATTGKNIDADTVISIGSAAIGVITGFAGLMTVISLAKTVDGVLFVKPVFYIECIENSEFNRSILNGNKINARG